MNPQIIEPFLIVLLPVAGGLLSLKNYRAVSVAASVIEVAVSVIMYLSPDLSGIFYVTNVSKVFVIMVASVYFLSTIYSIEYLEEDSWLSHRYYFMLFNFFTASMMFALTVNNYGLMWVGIEATTISSAILIMTENKLRYKSCRI